MFPLAETTFRGRKLVAAHGKFWSSYNSQIEAQQHWDRRSRQDGQAFPGLMQGNSDAHFFTVNPVLMFCASI
jgi:hypothetical protein